MSDSAIVVLCTVPTEEVAEPADADNQDGDGEEVGQHDPLDSLEGGGEFPRQRRQRDVGDTRSERSEECSARGERDAPPPPPKAPRKNYSAANSSIALARARSLVVIPPASCVLRAKCTLV